ncbi:MAG: rhomboid family intramembrane serine protease [Deltaproteobacteria bacterium]|nr:rhomboid family intramembrane serine protease [Deltaproteobacteria bacterium]
MSWQAKGGGSGWSGGGGGPGLSFGPGITPFGKQVCIALAVCFGLELFLRYWLGLGKVVDSLMLWPLTSGRFAPWQFVTHPFVYAGDPLSFVLMLLALYFFASTLERYLGTGRFQTFLLASTVGAGLVGWLVCSALGYMPGAAGTPAKAFGLQPFSGFGVPVIACVAAFGWLQPRAQILLMFILPIPAIYITYLTIGGQVVGLLTAQPWSVYYLAGIGLIYAVVQRGVRLPDLRRQWLVVKQRQVQKKLTKLQVIDGGKAGKPPDRPNGDPRKPTVH